MDHLFQKAVPVWITGREKEMNLRVQFKAVIPSCPDCTARIATSGMYQLRVNGQFVSYGPARAGKGHFRVDEIPIGAHLCREKNTVLIEVAGYNVNAYAIMNQPSFLLAELTAAGESVAWTGRDFTARVNPFYIQKINRYSFQRAMAESYRVPAAEDPFLADPERSGTEPLSRVPAGTLIPRYAPYPLYEKLEAQPFRNGRVSRVPREKPWTNRFVDQIGPQLLGFPIEELDCFPIRECEDMVYTHDDAAPAGQLTENRYQSYFLPWNAAGFVTARVRCHTPATLYIQFDEICDHQEHVNFLRLNCSNAVRYDLCPGVHELQLFEVYNMKYIQIVVTRGSCAVEAVGLTEYKHPPVAFPSIPDEKLQLVARAALENYRQNAVDIFMDCPGRERAGWLCDSRFSARTEYFLTGENRIERSFLENFLHEEDFACHPHGVFPMCYPSDHYNGEYIPQYHFHLMLELQEYHQRTGDDDLIRRFRPRIEETLAFFEGYENSDGLLERLDKWNFIEWSRANQLVMDVNYPTNMIYSAALTAMGQLYGNPKWLEKAEKVKQEVLRQSFDGTFFVDNAVRKDGKLVLSGEHTEVCQYYAISFGIVTPESHPWLFQTLIHDFGPDREKTGAWPEVHPAAPFIGFFLRLDALMRYGYYDQVRKNIEGYFYPMAQKTGTLWESVGVAMSCNHGFASYVLCWLDQLCR